MGKSRSSLATLGAANHFRNNRHFDLLVDLKTPDLQPIDNKMNNRHHFHSRAPLPTLPTLPTTLCMAGCSCTCTRQEGLRFEDCFMTLALSTMEGNQAMISCTVTAVCTCVNWGMCILKMSKRCITLKMRLTGCLDIGCISAVVTMQKYTVSFLIILLCPRCLARLAADPSPIRREWIPLTQTDLHRRAAGRR